MADFRIRDGENLRTTRCTIASATVVEAGDLVELDTGLIVKATATGARLAFAPNGSANGETEIDVTVGNDFTLEGTADANFAVTDKGILCDLVGTTNLLIDIGTASTNVFRVGISENAGTAASTSDVEVRINLPLF